MESAGGSQAAEVTGRLRGAALLLVWLGTATAADAPQPAQALLDQGVAFGQAGRLDDAEAVLKEGVRRFPSDARFALELAGLAYRRQNPRATKAYLHEALRLNPAERYGNDFLGTLYLLDGNLAAALKYWNRIEKPLLSEVQFTPPLPLTRLLQERTFEISAGQVLTYGRLLRTEANLDLLGVFSQERFELTPARDPGYLLTVRAMPKEPPLSGWLGKLLTAVRGLPYQAIQPDFYNLGHRGIQVTSMWRWDAQKRRVALDVSGPLHFWRYHLLFDGREENWDLARTYSGAGPADALSLRKAEAGADLERNLSSRLGWTIGTRLAKRQFRGAGGSFFFSGSWTSVIRNRFDYLLWDWPEARLRVDAWGELRTGRILTGSPSRLATLQSAARGRWFPQAKGEKYELVAELRSGAAFGNLPLDELFILGMERDNDLWLRGHVGTRDGQKGNAPMGRNYLLGRSDFARTLWELPFVRIQAGPFFDSGRISDPSGQFGSRGWMYDTGVQAKIGLAGGVSFLAVYGRNLRDGTGVFYTAIRR